MRSMLRRQFVTIAVLLLFSHLQHAHCFRVVAFGDSFTQGWDPQTRLNQPYTEALRNCLRKHVARRIGIAVHNRGSPWAGVMMTKPGANLTENVYGDVAQIRAAGVHYDWAVLWIAGVNDIVNARPPHPFPFRTALRRYQQLWDLLLQQGWHVLVMPQPTFMFSKPGKGPERTREKLAAQLQQWVHDAAALNPRLHYFDLATAMNGYKMSKQTANEYYSRRNHFTAKGYKRVGNLLCNMLGPYALQQVPKATAASKVATGGR